ncbi:MAG TPA: calcium-binding protein [Azospirillaceae bacterium]|nr:calcium-binding protein [Azospirillaceae bacterium]
MVTNWDSLYGWHYGDLSTFKSKMTGREIARGDTADNVTGNAGHDLVRARGGNDTVAAQDGDDWVDGGQGADLLYGGPGRDFVQGGDGADKIYGDRGNDILDGGAGNDYMAGRDDHDWLFGWTGNDTLEGDGGDDSLVGSHGDDVIRGGAGNDLMFSGPDGRDVMYGGTGDNVFENFGFILSERWGGQYETAVDFWDLRWDADMRAEFHLEGRNDTVYDNGVGRSADVAHYYGKGSATLHQFGGSTGYAPTPDGDPRFPGVTDRIVFRDLRVGGELVDDFAEFVSMIRSGRIGYSHGEGPGYYGPRDGTSTIVGWENGSIALDFGPAADGTPRVLRLEESSISGFRGVDSFSADHWRFQNSGTGGEAPVGGDAMLMLRRPNGDLVAWDPDRGEAGFRTLTSFAPAETAVLATGDFDGDAQADFFLQQKSGQNLWWDPSKGLTGFTLTNGHAGAGVAAVEQFAGSGADDLLLFDAAARYLSIHDVSGGTVSRLMPLDADTRLAGTGDINGQGGDELVFLNQATGAVYAYSMDGQWRDLLGLSPGSGWSLAGIGNVTGDAAEELVFRNSQSSATLVWEMAKAGLGFRDFAMLTQDWTVRAFQDLTGDGLDDLLVQHTGGNSAYWNGTAWVPLGGALADVSVVGVGVLA